MQICILLLMNWGRGSAEGGMMWSYFDVLRFRVPKGKGRDYHCQHQVHVLHTNTSELWKKRAGGEG